MSAKISDMVAVMTQGAPPNQGARPAADLPVTQVGGEFKKRKGTKATIFTPFDQKVLGTATTQKGQLLG
jgi:hypothetical protein